MHLTGWTLGSLLLTVVYCSEDWGYLAKNGPKTWCEHGHKECCGMHQSPINIGGLVFKSTRSHKVNYNGYNNTYDWLVKNVGHALQLTINSTSIPLPTISGGPLGSNANYTLANIHFHCPSEHALHSKHYDGEIHMVHYVTSAGSFTNALTLKDGIIVIATFIKISEGNVSFLDEFTERFSGKLHHKDSTALDDHDAVLDSLLPKGPDRCYYSYEGSLTTPECNEVVTWIINRQPVHISQATMDKLRSSVKTTDGDVEIPLFPNNRFLQPRNGRIITAFDC